jgi:multiple sugar transport system ATP-binding protein
MNFFEGSLSKVTKNGSSGSFKGQGFEASGIRLTSQEKKTNDPVRLGIRPQHLKIHEKGNLIGQVTLVEKLGTETVVELATQNGTPFRYAAAETPDIAVGNNLKFKFESSKAHLF